MNGQHSGPEADRATESEADRDHLSPLYDAALPADAPGAWIRNAIEKAREAGHTAVERDND